MKGKCRGKLAFTEKTLWKTLLHLSATYIFFVILHLYLTIDYRLFVSDCMELN